MPAAATTDQFLDLLRKSHLVAEARLQPFLTSLGDTPADKPRALAEAMARQGLLTPFQAGQLLSGKWKGFQIAGGKYKLLQLLGVGGMGKIYLCEHVRMKRLIALKILPYDHVKDATALDRFNREAQAAAALDHPNIVRAFDIDQDGPLHFLVLEYVDGSNLQEIVKKHGPLDVTRACHYIAQAATGLQHAHEAGWVHRDIKPGNLLLDRTGTVKILDMGLARMFGGYDHDNLTQKFDDKSVLGTADYLAPEQAVNSSDVDIRADIYSLGATLYFMLSGHAPFEEATVAEKLLAHQMKEPTPIDTLRADIPKPLVAVLKKMMAKKPVHRYQSPIAVVEAMQPWTQTSIEPPADEEMPRLCIALESYAIPGTTQPTSGVVGPASARLRAARNGFSSNNLAKAKPAGFSLSRWASERRNVKIAGAVAAGVLALFVGWLVWPSNAGTKSSVDRPQPQIVRQEAPKLTPKDEPPPEPARPNTGTIFVSKTPRSGADIDGPVVASLADALAQSKPGNRIIILDEAIQANVKLDDSVRHSGVSIEAGNGRQVTWSAAGPGPLVDVRDVANVRMTGFLLREPQGDAVVLVAGACPGMRLHDLQVSDFPNHGFVFDKVNSSNTTPIRVEKIRFITVKDYAVVSRDKSGDVRPAAIVIVANGKQAGPEPAIIIRDCRFEGLYRAAVTLEGPMVGLFERNRFFTLKDDERPSTVQSCDAYFWKVGATKSGDAAQFKISSNTVARYPNFLRVDKLPPGDSGSRMQLRSNLMVGGVAWAAGPGKPDERAAQVLFGTGEGNVSRPGTCTKGYTAVPRKFIDFKYLEVGMDDAKFLRYPRKVTEAGKERDHELIEAGADREPAGFPPID